MINIRCIGISGINKERCGNSVEENIFFCGKHKYIESLLKKINDDFDNEMDKFKYFSDKINDNSIVVCGNCRRWKENNKNGCQNCIEKYKLNGEKIKQAKRNKKIKCAWVKYDGNPCILSPIKNNKYCINHQYVNTYSDEQKNNCKLCKGCQKIKFCGDNKTCDDCKYKNKIVKNVENENAIGD